MINIVGNNNLSAYGHYALNRASYTWNFTYKIRAYVHSKVMRKCQIILLALTVSHLCQLSKSNHSSHVDETCDIVLRYVDGFGIGVYAGKVWYPDQVVEHVIGKSRRI